ncbi:hypothetical protein SNE40_013811 [Patella caerulea]|uniref:Vezatin n=1 Tax=Patella caerulea TaxID=87958 RepID=A0AAN8JGM6_PATCE
MNDEQDEDVIFENSPLYKHMRLAGMEDVQTETVQHVTKIPARKLLKQYFQVDYASLFIDILGKCYQSVVFYLSKTKWGTENLEAWYHMTTLKHVQNSKALEEEDSAFLENYINCNVGETTLTEPSVYDCFKKWNGPINYLSTGFLVYTLIWCTGIFPINLRPMADFLAVGFGICMMSTCSDVCFYWWKRRIFMDTTSAIQKSMEISEKVLTLTRQSLRLVQEKELVARGFTLVSQRVAVSGIEQTASTNSSKLCSELRKNNFHVARSGMLIFREATLKLLELHPLIPEVDSVSNYLASVPLSDYGPCLQLIGQQADDSQHLAQLTDGYSVAALRGMNQLFSLYLSEFIRRLTLCFIADAQIQGSPEPFDKLKILMEELYIKLEKDHLQLQRSYDFHKSSPLNREPSKPKFDRPKSKKGEFYTAVHSLDLHLQAALIRTQELSKQLEKEMNEESADCVDLSHDESDQSKPTEESWLQVMSEVKAELEACKGCWEEGIGRIKKTTKNNVPISPVNNIKEVLGDSKVKEVVIMDAGDYIIEDQVFEGYTDADNNDDFTWNWEPILSPEEKEKKKREKEEAKRLLSELRSVISVRAEDRERREEIALAKSRTLTSPDESRHLENFQVDLMPQSQKTCSENSKSKCKLEAKSVLSNSDIFSSTKAELSPFLCDQTSSLNISPILSENEMNSDKMVNNSIGEEMDDENPLPAHLARKSDIVNLNNSATSPFPQRAGLAAEDSFVSVSSLDNGKGNSINDLQNSDSILSTSVTTKVQGKSFSMSDSEYSTTSSKEDSCRQNSVDLDSSPGYEEMKASSIDSVQGSKSSSGFFEGKEQSQKHNNEICQNLDKTYGIIQEKVPIEPGNLNTISSKSSSQSKDSAINQDILSQQQNLSSSSFQFSKTSNYEDISGIQKLENDSQDGLLSTGAKQSDCDNISSSFYSPLTSFTDQLSGIAPLVDSEVQSSELFNDSKLTQKNQSDSVSHTQSYSSKPDNPSNNDTFQVKNDPCDISAAGISNVDLFQSTKPDNMSISHDNAPNVVKPTSTVSDISVDSFTSLQQNSCEPCLEDPTSNLNPDNTPNKSTGFTVSKPTDVLHNDEKELYETKSQPSNEETKSEKPTKAEIFEHEPEEDDLENTDSSEQCLDVTSPDTSSSSNGEPGQTDLDIRISRLPGANLSFSANIAAMAAARSINLNLNIDTFGDSSSEDEVCECKCDDDDDCDEESIDV